MANPTRRVLTMSEAAQEYQQNYHKYQSVRERSKSLDAQQSIQPTNAPDAVMNEGTEEVQVQERQSDQSQARLWPVIVCAQADRAQEPPHELLQQTAPMPGSTSATPVPSANHAQDPPVHQPVISASSPAAAPGSTPAVEVVQPADHGAPWRQYANSKIMPVLVDGMKMAAVQKLA